MSPNEDAFAVLSGRLLAGGGMSELDDHLGGDIGISLIERNRGLDGHHIEVYLDDGLVGTISPIAKESP